RTTDMQLKNAIFDLIQSQLQRVATARARPEYAFRIVDPAKSPERPIEPNRLMVIIWALAGGGALGMGIIFLNKKVL
ncbi:MAG: hypothetical protein D6694_11350, partial [Gammaproteobacteria bacterium]